MILCSWSALASRIGEPNFYEVPRLIQAPLLTDRQEGIKACGKEGNLSHRRANNPDGTGFVVQPP